MYFSFKIVITFQSQCKKMQFDATILAFYWIQMSDNLYHINPTKINKIKVKLKSDLKLIPSNFTPPRKQNKGHARQMTFIMLVKMDYKHIKHP